MHVSYTHLLTEKSYSRTIGYYRGDSALQNGQGSHEREITEVGREDVYKRQTQGVPIESLSQMMGHLSIKTTQFYAEVTRTKIDEDMTCLLYTSFSSGVLPASRSISFKWSMTSPASESDVKRAT